MNFIPYEYRLKIYSKKVRKLWLSEIATTIPLSLLLAYVLYVGLLKSPLPSWTTSEWVTNFILWITGSTLAIAFRVCCKLPSKPISDEMLSKEILHAIFMKEYWKTLTMWWVSAIIVVLSVSLFITGAAWHFIFNLPSPSFSDLLELTGFVSAVVVVAAVSMPVVLTRIPRRPTKSEFLMR